MDGGRRAAGLPPAVTLCRPGRDPGEGQCTDSTGAQPAGLLGHRQANDAVRREVADGVLLRCVACRFNRGPAGQLGQGVDGPREVGRRRQRDGQKQRTYARQQRRRAAGKQCRRQRVYPQRNQRPGGVIQRQHRAGGADDEGGSRKDEGCSILHPLRKPQGSPGGQQHERRRQRVHADDRAVVHGQRQPCHGECGDDADLPRAAPGAGGGVSQRDCRQAHQHR